LLYTKYPIRICCPIVKRKECIVIFPIMPKLVDHFFSALNQMIPKEQIYLLMTDVQRFRSEPPPLSST
jgi:hypothetical protein